MATATMANTKRMSDEEYHQTQWTVISLASLCRDLPLDGFLSRIGSAETLGPIVDPTLFLKGRERLLALKRLAQSLQPFVAEIQHQIEEGKISTADDVG